MRERVEFGYPASLLFAVACAPAAFGQSGAWVDYADETAQRLVADPAVSTADLQEKDYAWGDMDQDGDIDLVCVRKEPWNTPGRFRNVLFMNEGTGEGHAVDGVLVDRTAQFATDATDGGQGMLDATADRDVAVVDVNDDGWLDVVTSTTYGAGLPKTISHPRVYLNEGEIAGVWQGLRYEESRTPTMPIAPNFCGIGVGDVSGDQVPDLYFVEYNNTLEDRLWINDGSGTFADESLSRLTAEMRESDFGVHAVIADMNGDGVRDVVKDRGSTLSTPPLRITISYNDPFNEGVFDAFEVIYNGSPYFVEVGDLNGDGLLDIVIDDDGIDRYFLNQGNGVDGRADFITHTFPPDSNSFGGNIVIRDLNNDGHNDVLIADVDVDCCGCTRHMHIWKNQGDTPDVTFLEETGGIPDAARTGTHDVGVFDLNGDGWLDLVIGTCTGMSIWVAQPGIVFSYPAGGPPQLVPPDQASVFQVQVSELGGAQVDVGTETLFTSVGGGPFAPTPLSPLGAGLYEATLPPVECVGRVLFYVGVDSTTGTMFTSPPGAPAATHAAVAAAGNEVTFGDDFETAGGWGVLDDPSLTTGAWERVDPTGTISLGQLAAPDDDATPGPGNVNAFVTENAPPGSEAFVADVDGGPTYLISPSLDLDGTDATVSYARWFYCEDAGGPDADLLTVEVSNDDGGLWIPVPEHTTGGTGGAWETVSFVVGDYVTPTTTVRVRFGTQDTPNNSITEAGIDDFQIAECEPPCLEDCAEPADGAIDVTDLLAVLAAWGQSGAACDIDGGTVDVGDLLAVLAAWGPCTP